MNLRDLFLRVRALVGSAPRRTRARRGARVPHRARDAEAHRRRSEPRRRSRPGAGALRPGAAGRRPVPRRARHRASSMTWRATSSTRSARSAARPSPPSRSSRRWRSASGSSPWYSRSTTSSFFASMPCGAPASCLPWSGRTGPDDADADVAVHAARLRRDAPRDQRLHRCLRDAAA